MSRATYKIRVLGDCSRKRNCFHYANRLPTQQLHLSRPGWLWQRLCIQHLHNSSQTLPPAWLLARMREEIKAVSKDRLRDRGTSAEFSRLRGRNKMEELRGGWYNTRERKAEAHLTIRVCLIIERGKKRLVLNAGGPRSSTRRGFLP